MLMGDKNITYWSEQWLSFKHGDLIAFNRIYDYFFDCLYHYGCKLTCQTDLVEDCIQELFLTLYTRRDNLSETDNVEFYLLKALKLTIYGKLRKESRFLDIYEAAGLCFELEFAVELESAEDKFDDHIESIKKYLKTLKPESRELVYLKFYTNLNYKEIGEMLGIQPSSVKKQVYRIMLKMRNVLVK